MEPHYGTTMIIWSILYLVGFSSANPGVHISYEIPFTLDFYSSLPISFNCTAKGFSSLQSLDLMYKKGSSSHRIGCSRSENGEWDITAVPDVEDVVYIRRRCTHAQDSGQFNTEVRLIVSEATRLNKFYCRGDGSSVGEVLSTEIDFSNVQTTPKVFITYASRGLPDFYVNDQMSFTCTAVTFRSLSSLDLIYNGGSVHRTGCTRTEKGHLNITGSPNIHQVDGLEAPLLTREYCVDVDRPGFVSVEVKVTITKASLRGRFYCRGYESGLGEILSTEVEIPNVKAGPGVHISYESQGSPDFYLNDQITFNCTAISFTNLSSLDLVYDGGSLYTTGCTKSENGVWNITGGPNIHRVNGLEGPPLTRRYCADSDKPDRFDLQVRLTITDVALRGKFYCRLTQLGVHVLSTEVNVSHVKEPPGSFKMTVSPSENIAVGEEFSFYCSSPRAEYHQINREYVTTHIPRRVDRCGVVLHCPYHGGEHPNWRLTKVLIPVDTDNWRTSDTLPCTNVRISYTSIGSPDFYFNDEITVTCTASGFGEDLGALYLKYVTDTAGTVEYKTGCYKEEKTGCWLKLASNAEIYDVPGFNVSSIKLDHCRAIEESSTLNTYVTITNSSVKGGQFQCVGMHYDVTHLPYDGEVFSSLLKITNNIKVPPRNFTLTVYPNEDIIEGVRFSYNCSDPQAEYNVNGIPRNSHLPSRYDRSVGIQLTCKYPGSEHPNWVLTRTLRARYAPDNLMLRVYPRTPVVEGEEFAFNCSSNSSNATYGYYVKGEAVTIPKYTPEKSDRTGLNISCADTEFGHLDRGNANRSLIPLYAPDNLTLTISPNNTSVFEGEEFNFTCTSDDALAEFEYKINGEIVTKQNYTLTVADRGGVTITCTDKAHSEIPGGSTHRVLMPIYVPDKPSNNSLATTTTLGNTCTSLTAVSILEHNNTAGNGGQKNQTLIMGILIGLIVSAVNWI